MTRMSADELREGYLFNGFDDNSQAWIVDGAIRRCGHPASMRPGGVPCCNAYRYAGQPIAKVPGAETFPLEATRRA
jgi:hypothetical protein